MADYEEYDGSLLKNPGKIKYEDIDGKPINLDPSITLSKFPQGTNPKGKPGNFSFLGSALPALGSFAGPLGTGAGFSIQQALKNLLPENFGQPKNAIDTTVDAGKELLYNNVIPAAAGKIISKIPSVVRGIAGQSPAMQTALEASRVAKQGQQIEDFIKSPENPGRYTDPEVRSQFLQQSASSDASSRLFKSGYSKTTGTFDAGKTIAELDKNPEAYIGVPDEVRGFLKEAAAQTPEKNAGSFLQYAKNRFILSAPLVLGGLATGHGTAATGVAGTILLGDAAMKHILSNPQAAEILTYAMQTKTGDPAAAIIGKVVKGILKGTNFILRTPDDKDISGTIGPDGEFQTGSGK